jgi:hypothetical protein
MNGIVEPVSGTTDSQGFARASWRLGFFSGQQRVTAEIEGGLRQDFQANGTADQPIAGLAIMGSVYPPIPTPAGEATPVNGVVTRDREGRFLPFIPVEIKVSGGTFVQADNGTSYSTTSNQNGFVPIRWLAPERLPEGKSRDTLSITVRVQGLPSSESTRTFEYSHGAPVEMRPVADIQLKVGQIIGYSQIPVRFLDKFGNEWASTLEGYGLTFDDLNVARQCIPVLVTKECFGILGVSAGTTNARLSNLTIKHEPWKVIVTQP